MVDKLSLHTRNKREMLFLYKALVLPLFEYYCLLCLTNIGLIRLQGNIQRTFTRQKLDMTELFYGLRFQHRKL